jgi:hypothetical protein
VTELQRLLESSPNAKTRDLLRAGLGDRPSPGALTRTTAALAVAGLSARAAGATVIGKGVMGAELGASVGAAPALGAMAIVKWLGVGAIAGTLFAGGTTLVQRGLGSASPAATADDVATASDESGRNSTTALESEREGNPSVFREPSTSSSSASGTPRPGDADDESRRSPPPPTPDSTRPAPARPPIDALPTSERSSPLTVELERIDGARAALANGAAAQVLSELSEYQRVRSTGTLDREAWILRIDALLLLGRRVEARDLARRYLERFPRDAHAARLRELADGG